MKIFVCGKEMFGYLTGSTKPPKQENAMVFHTWDAENSMVMA